MAKTIFFMHIPKTAGTSVRHSASLYFEKDRALLLYGDGAQSTSPMLQQLFHGAWAGLERAQRFKLLSDYIVDNEVSFFSSHMQMNNLSCFVPAQAFAIFRDPVARVVSHYHQHLKTKPKLSLLEFIETPKYQNVQCRTLGKTDLNQIGVVGLQDQYEETLRRVNHYFQIELQAFKKNTAPLITQIKNRFVAREMLQQIEKLNEKDMDLFERARKRFAEQA